MSRIGDPWPRMMEWLESRTAGDEMWDGANTHTLRVEEFRQNGWMFLRVELPGVNPDKDIDVSVDEGYLTIEGRRELHKHEPTRSEFFYGHFLRTLPLPAGADPTSIKAEYADGILEILIKMPEHPSTSIHVPVRRHGAQAAE